MIESVWWLGLKTEISKSLVYINSIDGILIGFRQSEIEELGREESKRDQSWGRMVERTLVSQ